MDETAEESNVRSGSNRDVHVGNGGSAVEARVDGDELRFAVAFGLHHEPKPNGMVLGGVAPHDENHVCVGNVGPAVRHSSAAKRGGQTGHRWAVSKTGLIFVGDNAQAEAKLSQQ